MTPNDLKKRERKSLIKDSVFSVFFLSFFPLPLFVFKVERNGKIDGTDAAENGTIKLFTPVLK
jgi:hypothetical protein